VTDLLLPTPPQAHSAQHHHSPTKPERRRSQDGYVEIDDNESTESLGKAAGKGFFGGHKGPEKGRKWDHARESDPIILQSPVAESFAPWKAFVTSSMYGPPFDKERKIVDPSFLDEQTPGYSRPWRGDLEGEDPEKALGLSPRKKRTTIWYQRMQVCEQFNLRAQHH
jgi:hypothetical protein